METRFEFAQQLGHGGMPLFTPQPPPAPAAMPGMMAAAPAAPQPPRPQPIPPALLQTTYYDTVAPTLSSATQSALAQGANPGDKAMLLLASPEFMRR
jgi:hypothetical protein